MTLQDGYYLVNVVTVLAGLVILLAFIQPNIQRLERLPHNRWRVTHNHK